MGKRFSGLIIIIIQSIQCAHHSVFPCSAYISGATNALYACLSKLLHWSDEVCTISRQNTDTVPDVVGSSQQKEANLAMAKTVSDDLLVAFKVRRFNLECID